jgi:disulfide bond formation protein DsbB
MTESSQQQSTIRFAAVAVVLVGIATILGAWAFEMAGYVPCPLCLQQRIPYYVAIPIAYFAFVFARRKPGSTAARILMGIVGLLFLAGAGLAAYHAGVEWKFWPGPSDCSTVAGATTDAGNLLGNLQDTLLVRCDEAAWRLFGLSLAGWNFLISLALAGISLSAVVKR